MKTEDQRAFQASNSTLSRESGIRILPEKDQNSLEVEYSIGMKRLVSFSLLMSSLGISYYSYRIYKSLI
jgi:hypothetical protein